MDEEEGRIVADDDGRTAVTGLFVAGDIVNKAQQIVTAMAGGSRAAFAVNHDLLCGPP
jgi:thioredoxin reductase